MSQKIEAFEIKNESGLMLEALNYGAIITKLILYDKSKNPLNLVLNFDEYDEYIDNEFYLGGIVGRYANRIRNGSFEMEGTHYQLPLNEGTKHLHGGRNSFTRTFWDVTKVSSSKLSFNYHSPHMEEGYPGNLDVTMTYELTSDNELMIEYFATSDQKTIINFTNHAYFNLSGKKDRHALDHTLEVFSDKLVDLDGQQLPTGKIKSVIHSHFDFQSPQKISDQFKKSLFKVEQEEGYDHCYVFEENVLKKMAVLSHSKTGIALEVSSTEPGLQVYTGNHLKGKFKQYSGVCLETQHFPDSPNFPNFPSTLLEADKPFYSKTIYKINILDK